MNDIVLVTGGTGKTGRSLVAQLQRTGAPHRALSRHGEPAFDWDRPESWNAALKGVGAVYLVAPAAARDPYATMLDFIAAARDRGVRRFVFLSMAGLPAGGPMHGQVHQWLEDNADDWAVLQPSAFMQNFSEGHYLATIREEDRIYSNTGDGRVPFIDADDIAACAFAVLTAPEPPNAAFVLTGEESMSYNRVAQEIGRACGRPIVHVPVTTEEMAARLVRRGLPETSAAFLAFGYSTIAAGMADQVTDAVRTLTGRPAAAFQAFAQAHAGAWTRAERP